MTHSSSLNSFTGNTRAEIRKAIRSRRQNLSFTLQQSASQLLLKNLSNLNSVQQANSIAIYLSADGELDTMPFINWCWQQGKNVYLPVIHPFSPGNLLFLKYEKDTVMVENQFSIKEPKLDITQIILAQHLDIIFTPLVAFDNTGARLGMGGGFYDRTLSRCNRTGSSKAGPYAIGLAHDCQQINTVPTEYWDIPLPEILTPSAHFIFEK